MNQRTKWIGIAVFLLALSANANAQVNWQQESANYAKGFTPLVTEDKEGLKLTVQFQNPGGERVDISLLAASGEGMRFSVRDTAYAQVFNLSALEDGVYTLSLRKGKETVTRTIKLNTTSYTVRTKEVY
jgi:hypothetical protein